MTRQRMPPYSQVSLRTRPMTRQRMPPYSQVSLRLTPTTRQRSPDCDDGVPLTEVPSHLRSGRVDGFMAIAAGTERSPIRHHGLDQLVPRCGLDPQPQPRPKFGLVRGWHPAAAWVDSRPALDHGPKRGQTLGNRPPCSSLERWCRCLAWSKLYRPRQRRRQPRDDALVEQLPH